MRVKYVLSLILPPFMFCSLLQATQGTTDEEHETFTLQGLQGRNFLGDANTPNKNDQEKPPLIRGANLAAGTEAVHALDKSGMPSISTGTQALKEDLSEESITPAQKKAIDNLAAIINTQASSMNVLRGRALGIKQKSTPKISSKNLDLMVNFERRDSNVTQSSSSTYRDFLPKVTQQMEVTIAEALSIRTNPMTWNKLSKDFEQPALNELLDSLYQTERELLIVFPIYKIHKVLEGYVKFEEVKALAAIPTEVGLLELRSKEEKPGAFLAELTSSFSKLRVNIEQLEAKLTERTDENLSVPSAAPGVADQAQSSSPPTYLSSGTTRIPNSALGRKRADSLGGSPTTQQLLKKRKSLKDVRRDVVKEPAAQTVTQEDTSSPDKKKEKSPHHSPSLLQGSKNGASRMLISFTGKASSSTTPATKEMRSQTPKRVSAAKSSLLRQKMDGSTSSSVASSSTSSFSLPSSLSKRGGVALSSEEAVALKEELQKVQVGSEKPKN
jgi:hypothetical protein